MLDHKHYARRPTPEQLAADFRIPPEAAKRMLNGAGHSGNWEYDPIMDRWVPLNLDDKGTEQVSS